MSRVTGQTGQAGADAALRECPYCHGLFSPHKPNQKFCTTPHKDAFHAERRQAALEAYSSEGRAEGKNPAAVALGRLGGLARAHKLREMAR